MVTLTIDGREVQAEEEKTVLEAARDNNIYIPALCYHEGVNPYGACRLCMVEVTRRGRERLVASCLYSVEDGLVVKTDSPRIANVRRMVTEFLLARCPDSEELQDLASKLGIEKPSFTLKQQECILCGLCFRACREIVEADAITFIAQGKDRAVDEASVEHSLDKCIGCDTCAYICPTEAITVEDMGDTRVINTPSGKLEFKLKRCKTCGKYWAPEKQLDYIIKEYNLEPEIFDACPDCRD